MPDIIGTSFEYAPTVTRARRLAYEDLRSVAIDPAGGSCIPRDLLVVRTGPCLVPDRSELVVVTLAVAALGRPCRDGRQAQDGGAHEHAHGRARPSRQRRGRERRDDLTQAVPIIVAPG